MWTLNNYCQTEVIMLHILCIILFRISCNINFSALTAKISMYSQDHCQNNPVTLKIIILYCIYSVKGI